MFYKTFLQYRLSITLTQKQKNKWTNRIGGKNEKKETVWKTGWLKMSIPYFMMRNDAIDLRLLQNVFG